MAFVLPPIKDTGINVPSFSVAELASLPSTSLTSLANSMASMQSELDIKNAQLQTRANKLSGGVVLPDTLKGRSMISSTISADNVDLSVESTIAPVTTTAGIFDTIESFGAEILNNPIAAGTSLQDCISMATKIKDIYEGAQEIIETIQDFTEEEGDE